MYNAALGRFQQVSVISQRISGEHPRGCVRSHAPQTPLFPITLAELFYAEVNLKSVRHTFVEKKRCCAQKGLCFSILRCIDPYAIWSIFVQSQEFQVKQKWEILLHASIMHVTTLEYPCERVLPSAD